MTLYIYSLRGTLYEGPAEKLSAPAAGGEIAILENHVPLMTALKAGTLKAATAEGLKEFSVADGFLYTDGKKIVVLANEQLKAVGGERRAA